MTYRNQKYLDWIRQTKNCLVSGKKADVAHHVRENDNTSGVGLKPSDYRVLPLQHSFHTTGSSAIHRIGPLSFYKKFAIDPLSVMINQMKDYLIFKYKKKVMIDPSLSFEEAIELLEKTIESHRPAEEKERELNKIKKKKEKTRQVNREKRENLKEDELYQLKSSEKKKWDKELYEKAKELRPKQKVPTPNESYKEKQRELQKEYRREMKEKFKDQLEEKKKQQREFRKSQYRKLKELKKQRDSQKSP
ncbi:MAG: hypothetical protein OEY33_06220 [Bdellovibrionales bacterium]|jgi:hypothetical protein|nr:hypothetical protein [Bdellovibrionales bacterium]